MWLMATVRGQCRFKPPTQLEKLVWVLGWGVGTLQHTEITLMPPPPPWLRQTETGSPKGGKGPVPMGGQVFPGSAGDHHPPLPCTWLLPTLDPVPC